MDPILTTGKEIDGMEDLKKLEIWFITGSQHLYGTETLEKVRKHAQIITNDLAEQRTIPVRVVFKPVVKTPEEIYQLMLDVNYNRTCIGIITWMHTFSPAKMWINGLKILHKPLCHLHTQYNRDIPWSSIDMDFMNLHQSAHGDREFGFILTRMGIRRKVVVGHWQNTSVIEKISNWSRAAAAWHDWQGAQFVRFGDNMRQVAVTEGDKVEAQIKFGYQINTHGIGDLVTEINAIGGQEADDLCAIYLDKYKTDHTLRKGGEQYDSLREAARIELGLKSFLTKGNYKGFTDTFEDLHGLKQLPGIAVQRLMQHGYGFGAEGDWKTAALLRAMKVMSCGLAGGTSFMEDYTYHFDPVNQLVLGAHMLEICPSIAKDQPKCEIHPLGIGGKNDPVRLVFNVSGGKAINASLIDLGHRFRLLVNEVEATEPPFDLPKLPVARVLWKPLPDMERALTAWLFAGGAHHTVFSQCLSAEILADFAEIAGIEMVLIHDETKNLFRFKTELKQNEAYYR
jgi:L-arabinose isomerase